MCNSARRKLSIKGPLVGSRAFAMPRLCRPCWGDNIHIVVVTGPYAVQGVSTRAQTVDSAEVYLAAAGIWMEDGQMSCETHLVITASLVKVCFKLYLPLPDSSLSLWPKGDVKTSGGKTRG